MSINTVSPSTFTTSILIGDAVTTPFGGADSPPLMTMNNGQPVSAAIEIQSTDAGLLLPRMTTAQMNAIPNPYRGMLIYNTTDAQMFFYNGASWIGVAGGGSGDVTGPGSAITGDIAVFADTSGKVLADSLVNINTVTLLSKVNKSLLQAPRTRNFSANPTGLELSNLTYLQFNATQGVGLIFLGTLMPVEFIENEYSVGNHQISSLFTGGLPSSSTTPSALVELQSTTGALLLSRMTTVERNALASPAAGMVIFNTSTTPGAFNFYDGTSWLVLNGSSALPPITTNYQILSSKTGDATWYSRYYDNGSGILTIGTGAGLAVVAGSNTLVGYQSGFSLISGNSNSAFGRGALSTEITGTFNCAFGVNALELQNGANNNSAFGGTAGAGLTTGSNNSCFGFQALEDETTGSGNSVFGYQALSSQNGVSFTSAFGYQAAELLNGGLGNSCFGYKALNAETTGNNNTCFGYQSLGAQAGANDNSAFGYHAGSTLTTGSSNSCFGYNALLDETSGSFNCAFGNGSLGSQAGASNNAAFGSQSGFNLSTGNGNAVFGTAALSDETVGSQNCAFGYHALANQDGASGNTAIGYQAGESQVSYSNCTFVGKFADASGIYTNATAIGYNTTVGQSNALVLGNGVNVGIGTSTPNTSAVLDLESTFGALLVPRMTNMERNALTPAAGMVLFDTDAAELQYYNGTTWENTAGSGGNWVDQTTTSVTMAVNTSYVADNALLVTLTLPAACPFGSTFTVVGKGVGGWKIAQQAGQQINLGNTPTTLGATGYLQNTSQYDTITLVCVTANTTFVVYAVTGNITVN